MSEFVFRWTIPVFVRASRAIGQHAERGWSSIVLWVGAFAGLLVWSTILKRAVPPLLMLILAAIILLAWAFDAWVQPWLMARRLAREDPCALEDIRQQVGADGFTARTASATVTLQWNHIRKGVETDEFILYDFATRMAYFTPKRVVAPDDLARLRHDITSVLGSRAEWKDGNGAG